MLNLTKVDNMFIGWKTHCFKDVAFLKLIYNFN